MAVALEISFVIIISLLLNKRKIYRSYYVDLKDFSTFSILGNVIIAKPNSRSKILYEKNYPTYSNIF